MKGCASPLSGAKSRDRLSLQSQDAGIAGPCLDAVGHIADAVLTQYQVCAIP